MRTQLEITSIMPKEEVKLDTGIQGGTDTKIKQEKTDTPRLRQPGLTQTEDKTWRPKTRNRVGIHKGDTQPSIN